MNRAANDILMRSTINNYILKSQVDEVINNSFVNADVFNQLTYKENTTGSWNNSGIYVYAAIGDDPFNSSCNLGEYCASYASRSKGVIINEPASFNPKLNPSDTVKLINGYGGANRDETITVRLEAKVHAKVLFIGINIDFGIPLYVEKSGPAMFYYRI